MMKHILYLAVARFGPCFMKILYALENTLLKFE